MAKRRKMLKKKKIYVSVSSTNVKTEMKLDLSRFENQLNSAQWFLDSMVMTDMVPFMPMQTGSFINLTRARSAAIAGSGKVYAAAPPYGRYLYKGKVMVDELTGSTWARKGAKKVFVSQFSGKTNAKNDINFDKTSHPEVSAEWFEKAKKRHGTSWIKGVKEIAGGG